MGEFCDTNTLCGLGKHFNRKWLKKSFIVKNLFLIKRSNPELSHVKAKTAHPQIHRQNLNLNEQNNHPLFMNFRLNFLKFQSNSFICC